MNVVKGSDSRGKGKDKTKAQDGEEAVDMSIYIIDINGTKMPLRSIETVKELKEYDYNQGKVMYSILINEQSEGIGITVFCNIIIKCNSENHMRTLIKSMETQMIACDSNFVFVTA